MERVRSVLLGFLAAISFSFSLSANVLPCFNFLEALGEGGSLQTVHRVEWKPGKFVYFSNAELAMIFKNGPNQDAIRQAVKLMMDKGSFQIPVDDRGFIAASAAGSYNRALWFRDSGRMTYALPQFQRAKAVRALLKLMGSPRNRELFFLNLRNKGIHRMSSDELKRFLEQNPNPHFRNLPPEASMFVPHIRFQLDEIDDPRFFDAVESLKTEFKPQSWNHKQNDALAIVFLAAADAMKKGLIKWTDLGPDEQAALILVLAYGIHVEYYEKWDAGAWEEVNGRRTSSVAQFTDALIAFEKYLLASGRAIHLKQNPFIPQDIAEKIDQLIRPEVVRKAIEKGINIVKLQVNRGEAPDAFEPSPMGPRYSDSALSHIAWTMPEYLNEDDYRAIIRHLMNLRRDKGMLRYLKDVYLVMGQFWPADSKIPKELLTPGARETSPTSGDAAKAFWDKDHEKLEAMFGKGFEAQWVLGELMLMQMLPKLMDRYPESPHRAEYQDLLSETTMRFFSMVTGENAEGLGPVGLDGKRVAAWAIPEAWIPVRIYKDDGRVETLYSPSPFTPLYWAKAEAWVALDALFQYCHWDCFEN